MENVIEVDLTPEYRANVARSIKQCGVEFVRSRLIAAGRHPSFVNVLIKRIMGKEGW